MDEDFGEGRLIAQLEHPGIVPVHDAGVLPDGRFFYAMKLVRGKRLDEWMREHTPLRSRLGVFLRVCEPVAFAHSRHVVHRDLKPANIMVGDWGEVMVLDWGVGGTAGYMAPERDSGPRGDVYSLGRILEGLVAHAMPAALASISRKATNPDPDGRYAGASELAGDVERFLAGERVTAHRERLPERLQRLLWKHRAIAALIAAYLLMRIIMIFLV
jgi:serine/threonine protein kinase